MMLARAARLAFVVAAVLSAATARPQWETRPIVVWLERPGLDVVPGAFAGTAAGEEDLLVLDRVRRTAGLRPHHAPLTARPSAFPIATLPVLDRAYRGGYLAPNGTDALADVASHYATGGIGTAPSRVEVVFGHDPANVHSFALPLRTDNAGPSQGGPPYVVSFLRLLARSPPSDTLVMPYCLEDVCARLFVLDPVTDGSAAVASLAAPDLDPMDSQQPEAFPVWLTAAARDAGVDDVAVSSFGTVAIWGQASAASTLPALDLDDAVVVGTTHHLSTPPPWLPPSIASRSLTGFNEVHGVASLDVDLDGIPDLVFAMSYPPSAAMPGSLVWVKGTGVLADFADPARSPWHDLGAQLGLPDPVIVRPLRPSQAGGPPAVAIWDRTLRELVVVTAAQGRLDVWRAQAPGGMARDVRLADVVGTAAPDLVVTLDDGAQPTAVLVYPDAGGPWPVLSWGPGSPGIATRGVPHVMSVALDPGGAASVAVEWVTGAATSAPVGSGLSHVLAATCDAAPPPVGYRVRATSETGTMSPELVGTVTFAVDGAQTIALASPSDGRLVLPPGGATAVFDAALASSCGEARFGGTEWPAGAAVTDLAGPAWLRRTVVVTEAAYPALLAGPALLVQVATTDPVVVPSAVSISVPFDASGLVEVSQDADRTTLAPGEVTVVRTRLRSRIGVALPLVRVVAALSGLEPAGTAAVTGATLVSSERGGVEVVLSELPPAGGEVLIALPVRALARRSGAAAEARSSGGWALTPVAAAAMLPDERSPGCGCGAGSAPGVLAVALAALALRRRPPRGGGAAVARGRARAAT